MDAHLLRFDKAQWQEGQAKTMTSREHPETWGETGHGAPGKRGDCPEMLSAFLPDGPKQRVETDIPTTTDDKANKEEIHKEESANLISMTTSTQTHLQVVWQLSASGVAWVHCDEYPTRGQQLDEAALKVEGRQLHLEGVLDGEQLLRNHRQHLDVDAVELIKAGPGAALGQAAEELALGMGLGFRSEVSGISGVVQCPQHGQLKGAPRQLSWKKPEKSKRVKMDVCFHSQAKYIIDLEPGVVNWMIANIKFYRHKAQTHVLKGDKPTMNRKSKFSPQLKTTQFTPRALPRSLVVSVLPALGKAEMSTNFMRTLTMWSCTYQYCTPELFCTHAHAHTHAHANTLAHAHANTHVNALAHTHSEEKSLYSLTSVTGPWYPFYSTRFSKFPVTETIPNQPRREPYFSPPKLHI
eukprot:1158747-Pelagomonas_calceolata.AAC.23